MTRFSPALLLGVAALTMHLFHGLWSLTQTLGSRSSFLTEQDKRRAAAAISVAIGLGYASIPLAVITGLLNYSGTQ